MSNELKNRYDFLLVFDVQDGNPNGDPDAGNLPRVDAETGKGLVTDVCLKRKVRNYVQLTKSKKEQLPDGREKFFDIYVKEKAVLGRAQVEAFKELGIDVGQEAVKTLSPEFVEQLDSIDLCEGLSVREGDDDESSQLVIASDAEKKTINDWLKENKNSIGNSLIKFIKDALKDAKPRKPTATETEKGRGYMCEHYYDIRTFGAVMSLKSAPNCGQVRGPVQMTFARSVDPIVTLEHSITRMAVATEAEAEKQGGDNRTMGRKNTVPYGLYVARGFISPALARQTGFDEGDLNLLWQALTDMFEHDRSAARGMMSARKLIVFKHASALGNDHASRLFERVKIRRKDNVSVPRAFEDYSVTIDRDGLNGVELIEKL